MYTSLRQIVRGWARIFYGTFGTVRRLSLSLLVLLTMGLVPYAAVAVGLGMLIAGEAPADWAMACGAAGAAASAMQISVIYRFYDLIKARKWLAWTYPLGCAMAVAAVIVSLAKRRKGATLTWRGTSYASTELNKAR